jgi:hypothetical protein
VQALPPENNLLQIEIGLCGSCDTAKIGKEEAKILQTAFALHILKYLKL